MTQPTLADVLPPTAAYARMLEGFQALKRDLTSDDGPRISTMRAYRFALLQYDPALEYAQRESAQRLAADLSASGWHVLPISLQQLLFDRIRNGPDGPRFAPTVIAMEKARAKRPGPSLGPSLGLDYLRTKLEPLIEGDPPTLPRGAAGRGPNGALDRGLAGDVSALIAAHAQAHPDRLDRTLVLIGRVGALYPFFRVSALLRHLDGHTHDVPVVILYPGTRDAAASSHASALSFMGVMPADSDYRPRIYP